MTPTSAKRKYTVMCTNCGQVLKITKGKEKEELTKHKNTCWGDLIEE